MKKKEVVFNGVITLRPRCRYYHLDGSKCLRTAKKGKDYCYEHKHVDRRGKTSSGKVKRQKAEEIKRKVYYKYTVFK